MHLGIAHHLGWAVAVTATSDHVVVDRRRIELVEPGLPVAPIHHEGGAHALHGTKDLDDAALGDLVARVRASAERTAGLALDDIAAAMPLPMATLSLCRWAPDFPVDIATQRRVPYESRADSVMYRQVLHDLGRARGWTIYYYDAKTVEGDAAELLGPRAREVLHGPRAPLGPPWGKDHRMALAATVLAA